MTDKYSRAGGKYGGNHTTLIPAAAAVCDIANKCPSVTRISPGFIKAGLKSVGGKKRLKMVGENGVILLSLRDNVFHQEVRVYTNNIDVAMLAIARGARDAGFIVT